MRRSMLLLVALAIGLVAAAPKVHHRDAKHEARHKGKERKEPVDSQHSEHERSPSLGDAAAADAADPDGGIDDFVDRIMKLETEGTSKELEDTGICIDESEAFKKACVEEVLRRYNPDSSMGTKLRVKSPKERGLALMMVDRLLQQEAALEAKVQEKYEDITDDRIAHDEINNLRRSARRLSQTETAKPKSEWGKKRKALTMGKLKKRKMYLAWAKCARTSTDVFLDCNEFGPDLHPHAALIKFVLDGK